MQRMTQQACGKINWFLSKLTFPIGKNVKTELCLQEVLLSKKCGFLKKIQQAPFCFLGILTF